MSDMERCMCIGGLEDAIVGVCALPGWLEKLELVRASGP